MTSLVAASFFAAATAAVMAEASLEFLGLGNPATISWGTILYQAQQQNALLTGQWLMIFAPGVAIALLALSFTLINFGVDALSNPRLREKCFMSAPTPAVGARCQRRLRAEPRHPHLVGARRRPRPRAGRVRRPGRRVRLRQVDARLRADAHAAPAGAPGRRHASPSTASTSRPSTASSCAGSAATASRWCCRAA